MFVITGGTGNLGRRIINHLLKRVPANRIVVSTRSPDQAKDLAEKKVTVRYGDFAKPESMRSALADATQILLVSSNAAAQGGDPIVQHRAAIAAAKHVGARRLIYTSHMGASSTSAFPPMHSHAATEDMLRDSGIAWTALRNGFYSSTIKQQMIGDAASTGVLEAPEDGKVAWTAHDDLAAAAAAILVEEGRFDGPTPPLTAAQAHNLNDVARFLSERLERNLERRVISDEQFVERMKADDKGEAAIKISLGMYQAARAGEFAAVDNTLTQLIGREPISVRDVVFGDSDG